MDKETNFEQVPLEMVRKAMAEAKLDETHVRDRAMKEEPEPTAVTGRQAQRGRQESLNHMLDVFRLQDDGVLWLESAATLECAKARVQELAADAPGEYLVLDQKTGSKHVFRVDETERARTIAVHGR
jgi:hypothetical protein